VPPIRRRGHDGLPEAWEDNVVASAGWLSMLQLDPELATQLQRIAVAQMIMAGATVVVLLGLVAVALFVLPILRTAMGLMKSAERAIESSLPRLDPLIEKATRIADDANDVSDALRRKVHETTVTVEELNLALRRATRSADRRVREFGAVLDVVQAEAETLLLDAAATARGVHRTTEALHTPRRSRAARAAEAIDEEEP
jgi:uncharacterized protein YoxC